MNALTPIPAGQDYPVQSPQDDYGAGADNSSRAALRFLGFLRKYWWIPLLTLLLGGGGAAAYIVWAPRVFVSKASMWETEKLHLSEGALFTDDAQTYIGTQMELLKSGRMWQLAIDRLRASGTNAVPLGKDGYPLPITLKFTQAPKSTVFAITASSADPAFSRDFLNALMTEYLDYKKTVRKSVSGDTAASIAVQVETLERELKTAQDALTVFQNSNNLGILQEEGTIAGGYLARLQTQLSDLKLEAQLLQASAVESRMAAQGNSSAGLDPAGLLKTPGATGRPAGGGGQLTPYQEVELLKLQREKLSKNLRPKHPKIVALDSEIARGQILIELFRNQSREQLQASQEAVQMKMESVQASIKEWNAKVVASNSRIAEAERLKLNVSRAQSLHDRLADLLQKVDITRNTDLETLAIMEPASVARLSHRLDIMAAALGLLGGLGSGLGLVLLIALRDDRFNSVTEVNSTFGDAVVGMLPQLPHKRKATVPLLELNDPRHGYAEAYRSLRSALLFLATDGERPKILLITSAIPDEGKSTVAANLARTLALSGSRVLLVDGDLRKGHLHQMLHLENNLGLAELLQGTCDAAQAVQVNSLPNFSFISRGSYPGNPGDLFLRSGLPEILAAWRRDYDFVVIDSSPLFAADDASCLAPKVDGTLFVVRSQHSSARAVRDALELLGQRQARVLGVIVNGVNTAARSYSYYKYADYAQADDLKH